MLQQLRRSDIKYLRFAAMDEAGFFPGTPWALCSSAYERLSTLGLVVRREYRHQGKVIASAVATEAGRCEIARIRRENLSDQARRERLEVAS